MELAQIAKSVQVDASALAEALRSRIRGDVRFDHGSRALYATDGSNYRQVPIGVVLPRDADDVIATRGTLPRFRCTFALPRRRHVACRPMLQCRRRPRFLQIHGGDS